MSGVTNSDPKQVFQGNPEECYRSFEQSGSVDRRVARLCQVSSRDEFEIVSLDSGDSKDTSFEQILIDKLVARIERNESKVAQVKTIRKVLAVAGSILAVAAGLMAIGVVVGAIAFSIFGAIALTAVLVAASSRLYGRKTLDNLLPEGVTIAKEAYDIHNGTSSIEEVDGEDASDQQIDYDWRIGELEEILQSRLFNGDSSSVIAKCSSEKWQARLIELMPRIQKRLEAEKNALKRKLHICSSETRHW